jgi:chromosome segregation ATPase
MGEDEIKGNELTPEEIEAELKKHEGEIPFFVMKELSDAIKGKAITKEKFDEILAQVKERVDQTRLDKKLEAMGSQVAKLNEGIESIQQAVTKIPEVSVDQLEMLEQKISELSTGLNSMISTNDQIEAEVTGRIENLESRLSTEIPLQRIENMEKKTQEITESIGALSRDMGSLFLGGESLSGIIEKHTKSKGGD